MRSSLAALRLALACAFTLGLAPAAASAEPAPTHAQVTAEVEKLRTHPDLSGTRKQKTLRLKETDRKQSGGSGKDDPTAIPSGLGSWLRDFGRWVSEIGRVLVWVAGGVLVAALVLGLRHWVRVRAGAVRGTAARALPSHVRDLDIRPESLPEQIGRAAAALWQRGETRAALSLLYRGALSRLVHQHEVPIRASSTEGECLALAARRLPPERSAYFSRLVGAWQRAVYGARLPASDEVLALCAEFDRQWEARA